MTSAARRGFCFMFLCWCHACCPARGASLTIGVASSKRDGTYRWCWALLTPLRDEQGQIPRWKVAATDIEDRNQAEIEAFVRNRNGSALTRRHREGPMFEIIDCLNLASLQTCCRAYFQSLGQVILTVPHNWRNGNKQQRAVARSIPTNQRARAHSELLTALIPR